MTHAVPHDSASFDAGQDCGTRVAACLARLSALELIDGSRWWNRRGHRLMAGALVAYAEELESADDTGGRCASFSPSMTGTKAVLRPVIPEAGFRPAEDVVMWNPASPTRSALTFLMAAAVAFLGSALLLKAGGQPGMLLLAVVILLGATGVILLAMAGKELLGHRGPHVR